MDMSYKKMSCRPPKIIVIQSVKIGGVSYNTLSKNGHYYFSNVFTQMEKLNSSNRLRTISINVRFPFKVITFRASKKTRFGKLITQKSNIFILKAKCVVEINDKVSLGSHLVRLNEFLTKWCCSQARKPSYAAWKSIKRSVPRIF